MNNFHEAAPTMPVLYLSEDGPHMFLMISDIGNVAYDREQSSALADRLEAAAKAVRDHA